MISYVLKRLGTGLAALFLLITVTFFLTRLMPGSPFQNGAIPDTVVSALEEEYGLGRPLPVQYLSYIKNLSAGDLGISFRKPGISVISVIARAWPVSAVIGLAAITTALFLGTALGVWMAVSGRMIVRSSILIGSILGMAVPNFVIALCLMMISGRASFLLPVMALAVYPTAVVTRLVRNGFAAELNKDYVLMARAKGLTKAQIGFFHILRNIWTPVLNYIGPSAAFLMTGSFAVEHVFAIPGLGREFVLAITGRDYTMIMGLTIFMGMVTIVISLMIDLLCMIVNPQIRQSGRQ